MLKSKRPINNTKPEEKEDSYEIPINDWVIERKITVSKDIIDVNNFSPTKTESAEWQSGDWAYSWNANGMLSKVKRPDGKEVIFEYDALGRRTAKIGKNRIIRYIWDGNVILHEWSYDLKDKPVTKVDDDGNVVVGIEPQENVITWVYEKNRFVPCAKIINDEKFTIVSDYIGRPIQAYNEDGSLIWSTEYDVYGNLKNLKGDRYFIPFKQLGQYEDVETELYYNRFRYYDSGSGNYISKDPIGLFGNNPTLYTFVKDSNNWVDVFGLDPLGTTGYSVYALYESGSSTPYYIGITKQDVGSRMAQHMDTSRYGDTTTHRVLQGNITVEKARGYEQFYIEDYKTKTGKIGEDISSTNKGNKINSFDKSRTDFRGKVFNAEYDNIKKQAELSSKKINYK